MKKAVIYPNKRAPELFRSRFMNVLTWSHPAFIFGMYLVLAIVFIYIYLAVLEASVRDAILFFLIGFLSWTLAEYILHRFIYHKIKDASYDTGFHYMFHGIHHAYPNDKSKTVLPPVPSIIIAGLFFGIFYLLLRDVAFVFSPGFLIGYSIYMWIHTAIHRLPTPKRFNFWWKHHGIHHYQQHDQAFGVSTPLWDYVFGTMPEKGRKTIISARNTNDKQAS